MRNDPTTISLRVSEETKTRWNEDAKKRNLTLSRWIVEMVNGGISNQKYEWDGALSEYIDNWYYDEFVLPERESEQEKPDLEQFILSACEDKLMTRRCPKCGNLVPGNRKFCCDCGKKLDEWESPDDAAALFFFEEFIEGRRPKCPDKSEMPFILESNTSGLRGGTYRILERTGKGQYHLLHTISRGELDEAKKRMMEEEE